MTSDTIIRGSVVDLSRCPCSEVWPGWGVTAHPWIGERRRTPMTRGRRPETARSSIANMCEDFRKRSARSPRTLRFYREELSTIVKVLESGGRHTMPWEIDEEDVKWLLDDYIRRGLTVSTRRGYISCLRTWTEYYGNDVVRRMRIRWPADTRPNVDWITQDQAAALLALPKTPAQDLVVHCELCLGMRRVEVLRLRPDSFRGSHVEIIGKGPQGGKPRTMPYHRDTDRVLDRYLRYRQSLIDVCRAQRPSASVPESLLIWARGGKLHEYGAKGTGIDAMIKSLGRELGIEFSNHTLRRTFGRTMYRSGVEPATISKMLGHESIDQTLKYIGVDLDDMNSAMAAFALR